MDWTNVAKRCGIKDKLDDTTAEDVFGKLADSVAERDKSIETLTLSAEQTKRELETLKAKAAKPEPDRGVDPEVLELSRDSRNEALDALVDAGRITPGVRDQLAKAFVGAPTEKTLELSLQAKRVSQVDVFKAVVAALKDNDPVQLAKDHSGFQGKLVLSNPRSEDGGKNPVHEDMDRRRVAAGLEPMKV